MKAIWTALAAAVFALMPATAAQAQFGGLERTEVKEGYELKPEARILVFRPSVRVGAQTTGGMNEPNVEWTEAAKTHLIAALEQQHRERGAQLVMVGDAEEEGELGDLVADYSALFSTVANSALQHKMVGPSNRLPTKRDRFDWTLGEGAARLKPLGGDYGLFLYTFDSYGSTGRKIVQGLALLLGGGFMPSGVHLGYAGLVDLDTGDLVWLNVDTSMGGDVRTAEGADKRVRQLMEEFPLLADPTARPDGVVIVEPFEGESDAAKEPQPQPQPKDER